MSTSSTTPVPVNNLTRTWVSVVSKIVAIAPSGAEERLVDVAKALETHGEKAFEGASRTFHLEFRRSSMRIEVRVEIGPDFDNEIVDAEGNVWYRCKRNVLINAPSTGEMGIAEFRILRAFCDEIEEFVTQIEEHLASLEKADNGIFKFSQTKAEVEESAKTRLQYATRVEIESEIRSMRGLKVGATAIRFVTRDIVPDVETTLTVGKSTYKGVSNGTSIHITRTA